jgi:UPF0716 protein FxsA
MRLSSWFIFAIVIWLAAEVAAFVVIVHYAGLTGAILIGILTSLIGAALLRRLGFAAARTLHTTLTRGPEESGSLPQQAMLDGTLAALGSLLLILPGFLSDLIGFALAAPAMRQWLVQRFGGGFFSSAVRPPPRPDVVDLSPDNWRHIDETPPPPPKT